MNRAPARSGQAGSGQARSGQAGVTLVEVLVSLVIFAIIGIAGYATLDLEMRSARLTEGRLQRLGQMERALYLVGLDFRQAEDRSLVADGTSVSIRRAKGEVPGGAAGGGAGSEAARAAGGGAGSGAGAVAGGAERVAGSAARAVAGGDITVGYVLAGTLLTRRMLDGQGTVLADQALLPGVAALGWQFLDSGQGWSGVWPPPDQTALADGRPDNPQAVELTLTLSDGKSLRRVVVLPAAVQ